MNLHRGNSERTITAALSKALEQVPDRPFLITSETSYTFRDVDQLANEFAHGLLAHGVKAGETVAIMMSDHVLSIVLWLAVVKMGAIDVTINTGYQGQILAHVVKDSQSKVLIASAEYLPRLADIELGGVSKIYIHGDSMAERMPQVGVAPLDILRSADGAALSHCANESDILSIIYTSGTTGPSKGVMVCHAHAYTYATGCAETMELCDDDILYTAGLPQFHITARLCLVGNGLIFRIPVAMPSRFSVSKFWDDVRYFRATKAVLMGAMATLLKGAPAIARDRDHTLRKVLMAPLLKDSQAFKDRFGVDSCTCYGGTEFNVAALCPQATGAPDSALVGIMRSDLFELKVFDENDEEVAPGVVGELVIRSIQPWLLMRGYWGRPEATTAAWRNLWYHTGDAGRYDAAGQFYFVDRLKDTIRRRGENISSMEVESVIVRHPAVLECAVFPVESELTEQDVMTAIVLKPGIEASAHELWRYFDDNLPAFMVPRYIDLVDTLPKTMNGKITKIELKKRGVSAQTNDRGARWQVFAQRYGTKDA